MDAQLPYQHCQRKVQLEEVAWVTLRDKDGTRISLHLLQHHLPQISICRRMPLGSSRLLAHGLNHGRLMLSHLARLLLQHLRRMWRRSQLAHGLHHGSLHRHLVRWKCQWSVTSHHSKYPLCHRCPYAVCLARGNSARQTLGTHHGSRGLQQTLNWLH